MKYHRKYTQLNVALEMIRCAFVTYHNERDTKKIHFVHSQLYKTDTYFRTYSESGVNDITSSVQMSKPFNYRPAA
jgi:hypothetical protein